MRWSTYHVLLILPTFVRASSRIIGGELVSITDIPYQLSLRFYGIPICGAAILNQITGITAAHCLNQEGAYSVKAGSDRLYDDGVVIHVIRAIVHPQYNKITIDYDVALLFLITPLIYSDKIKPIKLPSPKDTIIEGMIGRVSGWGSKSPLRTDTVSKKLRAVEVPVWHWKKCKNTYFYQITKRMFCAGYLSGKKDACQGDSGGPFVVQGVLFGIVSSGFECAQPGYPGVYTNVIAVRSFIKEYAGL